MRGRCIGRGGRRNSRVIHARGGLREVAVLDGWGPSAEAETQQRHLEESESFELKRVPSMRLFKAGTALHRPTPPGHISSVP